MITSNSILQCYSIGERCKQTYFPHESQANNDQPLVDRLHIRKLSEHNVLMSPNHLVQRCECEYLPAMALCMVEPFCA